MTWNIDPEILNIGPLSIRWYGLLFAAAFAAGFYIIQWIYEKEGLDIRELDRIFVYVFIGTLAGARLGHCLLYDPVYYLGNPLEILKIWEGGLASHGGALGIFTALYIYSRKSGAGFLMLLDRIAIPAALAGAFIRTGNLFNSEIVGTPYDGLFSVVFKRVDNIPRHPVQLYEASAYALIFFILVVLYLYGKAGMKKGLLSGVFLLLVFSSRFLLEFVKTEQAAYHSVFGISTGQWLSVPFVIIGLILVLMSFRK